MHSPTAWGQWAMELLQCTVPLPGDSGQWYSCNALPLCLGALGSGPPTMHCRTAWGHRAVELLQSTAALPRGSGQWNCCNALPHCLGAVGSGTAAMHCRTAWGQWAVEILQCTTQLPGASGQWPSCNSPPHCVGAVGRAPPAIHRRKPFAVCESWTKGMGLLAPFCVALAPHPDSNGLWMRSPDTVAFAFRTSLLRLAVSCASAFACSNIVSRLATLGSLGNGLHPAMKGFGTVCVWVCTLPKGKKILKRETLGGPRPPAVCTLPNGAPTPINLPAHKP